MASHRGRRGAPGPCPGRTRGWVSTIAYTSGPCLTQGLCSKGHSPGKGRVGGDTGGGCLAILRHGLFIVRDGPPRAGQAASAEGWASKGGGLGG